MAQNTLKQLKKKIIDSMNNLVTLEIITAVGPIQMTSDSESSEPGQGKRFYPDLDYSKNPKMIVTRIDMLQGDIQTYYDEEFITGEYQALRAFHAAREKEGYEMVKKNIENLKSLLKLITDNESMGE